jgi:hypothetical protein
MRAYIRIYYNDADVGEDLINLRKKEIAEWVHFILRQWPELVVVTEKSYMVSTRIAGVHVHDCHMYYNKTRK